MCKMFIGSVVTELTTQEPQMTDQPHNVLPPAVLRGKTRWKLRYRQGDMVK